MKKKFNKIIFLALILPLTLGVFGAQPTNAYYGDIENSPGNIFSAALLDFILTNNSLNKLIGPEALGEISHASVAMPESGSLPMQYILSNNISNNDFDFCSKLTVEAKLNGLSKYSGPLSGLAYATTTEFGSWEFRFDLPPNVSVPNGAQCNEDALFSAWRADITNRADSSWHDEETLNISFTARMVVLNEIFARPNGGAAPKDREYIELYNNGTTPVDTLGWQISEIAGTTETFYPVIATGAVSGEVQPYNGASTIIPAGGWLVLEFGGSAAHLNDTGDTVKLYDNVTTLLDSHAYPAVSAGKAVVRFPDGIGFWVDPEPTPGTANMVSLEDLRAAGFDDAMIAQVLELVALKDAALLNNNLLNNNGENQIGAVPVIPAIPTVPEILPPVEVVVPGSQLSPDAVMSEAEPVIETTLTTGDVVTIPKAESIPVVENIIIPEEPAIKKSETIIESEPAIEPEVIVEPEPIVELVPAIEPVPVVVETSTPELPPSNE